MTGDFIRILEDVQALNCVRERGLAEPATMAFMTDINSQTAFIQSRLVELPKFDWPILECVRIAAFMCSALLCCAIWCARVMPVSNP